MKFAILGLLVVLLIGFFVVVWKAAQHWRWYQITAVCITMLLAMIFLFPTAGVLASRSAWHKIKQELETRAAQVQAEYRVIKYGDAANPEAGPGVVALQRQLAKLGTEAGRRWRNLRLQNIANNNIVLVDPQGGNQNADGLPPEAPQEGDNAQAAPPQPLVPQDMVVYGFAEAPSTTQDGQQMLLPNFYMGEFRVTSSTPQQVTLTPLAPLMPSQLQRLNNQRATSWSLYEMLPLDGHRAFIAEGSSPSEDFYFGRVDEEWVRNALGSNVSEETLQQYLRDGSRATQDDPPISRWTKIEFTEKHNIEVDSPEQRGALDGGYFDGNGRAVDARLQRGDDGKVTFEKGDQILLKEDAANQLIDQGVAELRDQYYLRPLNDYRFVLRRIRLRLASLENRTEELQFEKNVLEEAIENTEKMLVTNQVVKDKLEQDYAQFKVESTVIREYTDELRQKVDQLKSEMAQLHRENIAMERELAQKHLAVERRVSSLTAAE